MKTAFLFAGQGSQFVGMGKDLYSDFADFKEVFDYLPKDLQSICFDGPLEKLSMTENTQACMVAFAAGVSAVLAKNNITPCAVAGLSLGEYSALQCAGVFDAKTAIELVIFRGTQMANATKGIPCKMAAVLQLDKETVQNCCEQSLSFGIVQVANYNCPGQIVIAGETAAVDKACELCLQNGARRVMPLAVSGAFHTTLMAPAAKALKEKFKQINFIPPLFPVIFNCTAQPLSNDETIPYLLEKQVQSSVYFEDTIKYLEQNGVDTIIEIGPGKTLAGFVKKTSKDIKVFSVENSQTLNEVINFFKEI